MAVALVAAVVVGGVAGPHPAQASDVAPPSLEGVYFTDYTDSERETRGEITCDPDETSTVTFTAWGEADGPYPGRYEETGSFRFGPVPQSESINFPPEGAEVTAFSSSFRLESGDIVITGRRWFDPEATTTDTWSHGYCDVVGDWSIGKIWTARIAYEARIETPTAVYDDTGETFLELQIIPSRFGDPTYDKNVNWFRAMNVSSDGLTRLGISVEPSGLVRAAGTSLTVGGEPYTFAGMNVYNANNRVHWCWYPFTQPELEASFTEMGEDIDVIRAWFFQDFATQNGERSWTAFDETIAAAEATGKKLIVTLGNQWADCDSEGLKGAEWYESAYTERNPALPASYRDYVAEVVSRYAGESTVLMWQLLNEAEVPLHTSDGLCNEATAHGLLKEWAGDVSSLIKKIDPFHLVSIGTIGSGQCGAQYTDYQSLHELPTVDLCEFHDYEMAVMPGDQWNGLAFRIEQCNELNKPIFVGETGINPQLLDGTLQARADLFRDKFGAQFSAGVAGEVLWAWNAFESRTDTYDIGPGDPVFEVLAGLDDPDADGDGVVDSIGTGNGGFDDGAGTTGSIVDTAGHDVLVAPDADGVRITVAGTGTTKATFTVCGFTLRLAPGSEVVVSCGSITTEVISGGAELVLGDGLITVSIPAGVTATLTHNADGSFSLSAVSGGTVTVTVDGVTTQVGTGQSLTLEAWRFIGFADPVNNDGVLNVLKAGQAVPLKWRVLDAAGAPVTDLSSATVRVSNLACSAGSSSDQLEEIAAGASALQNLGDGYYQFNWKSPKNYANSCKTLRLDIGDGVEHIALFRFTK